MSAEQWTPWFDWVMDLVKFAITFGISALVTVLIINRVQENRAKKRGRADALFQLWMDALRDFQRAATAYEVAALSAYTDLYQWTGKTKTDAMQRYENEAYGDFLAALQRLEHRYAANISENTEAFDLMNQLDLRHKVRHSIYDEIIDLQLDSQSKNHNLWSAAYKSRNDYNKQLDQAKHLKQEIISVVERDIVATEER